MTSFCNNTERAVAALYVHLFICFSLVSQKLYILFQDDIDRFHYTTFYLHFTFIAIEMVLSFMSDFPRFYSPQGYQQLTEETQPLLVASGVTKKESVAGQDQKAKKVKITY